MGVQYDVNDRLQLRAGYEYQPSAIPKGQADILCRSAMPISTAWGWATSGTRTR